MYDIDNGNVRGFNFVLEIWKVGYSLVLNAEVSGNGYRIVGYDESVESLWNRVFTK